MDGTVLSRLTRLCSTLLGWPRGVPSASVVNSMANGDSASVAAAAGDDDGDRLCGVKRDDCSRRRSPSPKPRYCICRRPYEADSNGDMVCCDSASCSLGWYHTSCLFLDVNELARADKFVCPFCSASGESEVHGPARTLSPPRPHPAKAKTTTAADAADTAATDGPARAGRAKRQRRTAVDYASLNQGEVGKALRRTVSRDAAERCAARTTSPAPIRVARDGAALARMPDEPFVARAPDGLDMHVPAEARDPEAVARQVGLHGECEALDVATQSELEPRWTLGQWICYFTTPPAMRQRVHARVLNLISLEISHTPVGRRFRLPRVVREADWTERVWAPGSRGRPKVQLYYLMGAGGAYTSWHVDFGGSSVFYHLLRGRKVFYLARPTRRNLGEYERWQANPMQDAEAFEERLSDVWRVELEAGNTLIIPSGWLHAVYTPEDAVVLGGNFLHLRHFALQHRVFELECRLRVPSKYLFPSYRETLWLAAQHYAARLAAPAAGSIANGDGGDGGGGGGGGGAGAGGAAPPPLDTTEMAQLWELARVLRGWMQTWKRQKPELVGKDGRPLQVRRRRMEVAGIPSYLRESLCAEWLDKLEAALATMPARVGEHAANT